MNNRRARPRGQGQIVILVLVTLAVAFAALVLSSYRQVDRRELVVWTAFKDAEIGVLLKIAAAFEQAEHVPVRIVRVPFQELQPKVQVSVPVGQGPDLVTGPHDWIGTFVQAGMVQPAQLDAASLKNYIPVSVQAMSYKGGVYGLPVSVSTLGLVINKKLVPTPPKSFPELIEMAQKLTHDDTFGFLFDDTDFFFAYPFFGGYGGYIFADGPQGLDPMQIGLDNEGSVKAAQLLSDLHHKYKLIPVGTKKESASSLFREEKCGMTITGPWALQDYRDKKIDYQFMPIPMLDNGKWPQPLVSVDGIMLTSCSKDPVLAARLMLALASKDAEVELNEAAGRIPARLDAQADPRVAKNPDVPAIGQSVDKGIPMPAIPAVQQVWGPMGDALTLITAGQAQAETQLHSAVQQILNNIRKSME